MSQYLVLRDLRVNEANVHAGFYSAGLPALTAFAGFCHALCLTLQRMAPAVDKDSFFAEEAPVVARINGFLPIFTTYEMGGGPARRVNYEHGAKAGEAASAAFDPIADLHLNLILHVGDEGTAEMQQMLFSSAGRAAVQSLRLSGGSIFWDGEVTAFDSLALALGAERKSDFVLEDAAEFLREQFEASGGSLLDVMDRLALRAPRDDTATAYRPRHVAVGTGFRALEDSPHSREGARHGYAHRFVEPLVGLARVRLVASALKAQRSAAPMALLWEQHPPTPTGYYLVRARAAF